MLRFEDQSVTREAHEIFEQALKQARRIEAHPWGQRPSLWERWKNRWAHFLLARVDPFVALRQFHTLKYGENTP